MRSVRPLDGLILKSCVLKDIKVEIMFACFFEPLKANYCLHSPSFSSLYVFSLLWPSPRISPKLWVRGSCPARWLLRQRWRPQQPRTRWLCAQLRPLPTRTPTTSCKVRLSATLSWDLLLGQSALPTGQSSSLLTDASSCFSSQSGSFYSKKAHCEATKVISKEQLIIGGAKKSNNSNTEPIEQQREGTV